MPQDDLYRTGVVIRLDENTDETMLVRNKIRFEASSLKDKETHTVIEGDRLDQLSYRYYGSNRYWFYIADANDFEDTLINPFSDLVAGTILIIPDIDAVANDIR